MDRRNGRRGWSTLALGLIAPVAIALAVNALVTSAETKEARSGVGRVVEFPGDDLHLLDVGSAPPIVLIHGYMGSITWWDRVITRLARRHRVVAVDLLGHGDSDKPRDGYSLPNQARLVARALAARGRLTRHRRRPFDGRVGGGRPSHQPSKGRRPSLRPRPGHASTAPQALSSGFRTPRSSASSCGTSRRPEPLEMATRSPRRRASRFPTAS